MEPKGSLSCSQKPDTGPYPQPDASSPHISTTFHQDSFVDSLYNFLVMTTFFSKQRSSTHIVVENEFRSIYWTNLLTEDHFRLQLQHPFSNPGYFNKLFPH
jgi:hypothetical protein